MSGELIAAVCTSILWAFCLLVIITTGRRPKQETSAALARLNTSLHLTSGDARASLWPSFRTQFRWGTWPLLHAR
jgi:hypothetical protein